LIEKLKTKIRKVKDSDRGNLPIVSYSKLNLFEQCKFKYKLQYIEKNFSDVSAIHLDLGNLIHKVLEIKGRWIIENASIDYEELKNIIYEGIEEITDKGSERIIGVKEIKRKYFEEWYEPDNKSGMNYEEKIDLFIKKVLPVAMLNGDDWRPISTEQRFEFVYDNRVIIHGFIDRVDIGTSEALRVVDYKTSKSVFNESMTKTPLQMIVYALACVSLYERIPEEYLYSFVLINKEQLVCSKGYMNRGIKKLNKLLDQMMELEKTSEYAPSPTPLCYWCTFASHTPNGDPKYKNLCPYYSLWKPDKRTFEVNMPYDRTDNSQNNMNKTGANRKLVF